MTCQLTLNWKSFAALGATALGFFLAKRLTPDQAKEALICLIRASEAVITGNSDD